MSFVWIIKSVYPAPFHVKDLGSPDGKGLWIHPARADGSERHYRLHEMFTFEQIQNSWGLKEAYQKDMIKDVQRLDPGTNPAIAELQSQISQLTTIVGQLHEQNQGLHQQLSNPPPQPEPVLTIQSAPEPAPPSPDVTAMFQQLMDAVTGNSPKKRHDLSVEEMAIKLLGKMKHETETTFDTLGTSQQVDTGAANLAAQLGGMNFPPAEPDDDE